MGVFVFLPLVLPLTALPIARLPPSSACAARSAWACWWSSAPPNCPAIRCPTAGRTRKCGPRSRSPRSPVSPRSPCWPPRSTSAAPRSAATAASGPVPTARWTCCRPTPAPRYCRTTIPTPTPCPAPRPAPDAPPGPAGSRSPAACCAVWTVTSGARCSPMSTRICTAATTAICSPYAWPAASNRCCCRCVPRWPSPPSAGRTRRRRRWSATGG